jgi:hypothetical protein
VLQDLRPSTKTIAEFRELFGEAPELRAAGTVTWAWREKNVLVPARIETSGDFVDLDDVNVIRELELQLAELLGDKDIDHLDISTLRSKDREVTQHISRTLYDLGAAGLRFRSNCDDQPCFVLYEDRAFLQQDGDPEPCTADIPELLQVCSDYGLIAERRSLA